EVMRIRLEYHNMEYDVDSVNVEMDYLLGDCYKHIGCHTIDIVDIDNTCVAIVDDEGLLKRGNHVFDFSNGYPLGGDILIATNEMNEDMEKELKTINIDSAFEFLCKYKIKLIGKTR